eukprot:5031456-Amphidinium_carterae.1
MLTSEQLEPVCPPISAVPFGCSCKTQLVHRDAKHPAPCRFKDERAEVLHASAQCHLYLLLNITSAAHSATQIFAVTHKHHEQMEARKTGKYSHGGGKIARLASELLSKAD